MNKFLPWLKAHWPIPVLLLVAITAAPTAYYFARQMEQKQVADFQSVVSKEYDSIAERSAKINYSLPDMNGAGKLLEQSKPANEAMIKRYGEILAGIQSKVSSVSDVGLKFNQGEHKLLVEGLFPPPPPYDRVSRDNKGREFIEKYIEFHKSLLQKMRAGDPPPPVQVAQQLAEYKAAAEAKFKAETGHDMGPEEQAKLAAELTGLRIGACRKRAGEIGVYADVTAFEGVPTAIPDKAPSPSQAWDMQERSWVNQDICQAVTTANGNSAAGVAESVVKRLIKISIAHPAWDTTQEMPQPSPFDAGEDKAPLSFVSSITGRMSGPGTRNKWFDVRNATVEVIVSSQRLPAFLNALCATNFMTIVDLDLVRVEPLNDLRDGFDYGDEHVVRATVKLETVWLREWRRGAMPPEVQAALGMDDKAGGGPTAAAPASRGRPAPAPAPGRPGAPGGGGRSGRGDDRGD